MRLLVSVLAVSAAAAASLPNFSVMSEGVGAWPEILSSVGLQAGRPGNSSVFVLRAGAGASQAWVERVDKGAFLILEGESPAAEMFGFHALEEKVRVGSIVDARRPKLPIIWAAALELPRTQLPEGARVFAKERWTGAPMLAGIKRGAGAVLWVATNPGEHGYERFPYILQALADLGLEAPFRSARLWALFDYSYRTRVDLDYFAAKWRASGISALHVAAWHFYDADPERDAYLNRLIAACHKKGILIYAWIELPHVSEKFWNDHPEWREKTAVLQDAHLDWRKLMNLQNRDCFRAASAGVKALLKRFDWDGVNMAELYFESLEGAGNPSRFTPFNDDARAMFRNEKGWDPLEIWKSRKDAESLRTYLDWRADLARRMQSEWIAEMEDVRKERRDLDLVLTHVDDRFDKGMKDSIGADAGRVVPLLDKHDFTLLIEDPATVWNLGPQRYPEIAKQYAPLTKRTDKLAIDINIVERYQDVYPTKQQTGTELFQLVHLASKAFARVALYFENSILATDTALLPASAATVTRCERMGDKTVVESPQGVGFAWKGPALVDGRVWPVAGDGVLWLPGGKHTVEPAKSGARTRVLDFNGELKSAEINRNGSIELAYASQTRALAILDRKPTALEIDGEKAKIELAGETTLLLPRGQHLLTIYTQ